MSMDSCSEPVDSSPVRMLSTHRLFSTLFLPMMMQGTHFRVL
jgi:hypothetical protein